MQHATAKNDATSGFDVDIGGGLKIEAVELDDSEASIGGVEGAIDAKGNRSVPARTTSAVPSVVL